MKVKGKVSVLVLFFLALSAGLAFPEISLDNAGEYLEYGELQYQISVNFQDSEGASRVTPNADLAAVRAVYKRNPTDTNARNVLEAANASGENSIKNEAYEEIRLFLESGKASVSTVLAAMDNRSGTPELAYRIALFYQQVYPQEAELYFRAFLVTIEMSLNRTVPALLNEAFSLRQGEDALFSFFDSVRDAIFLELLDKAIALDPEKYRYYVASVGFRSLARWFSQMGALSMSQDIDLDDLFGFFRRYDPLEGERIRAHLHKALTLRPASDIEAFLAAALYHTSLGDMDEMKRYADLAVRARPDIPKAWNAAIFSLLFANMGSDTLLEDSADKLETLLSSKINNIGPDAYDYYVLASLQKYRLADASSAVRKDVRKKMRAWAEKSLETEETFFGLIVKGNADLLDGGYDEALAAYNRAEGLSEGHLLYCVYTNRGVLFLLTGQTDRGLAELRRSLTIDSNGEKAAAALALYE